MDPTTEDVKRIKKIVLNNINKETTDKMVSDLLKDYEDVAEKIITETIVTTIDNFDLKKVTEIYDELETKAHKAALKDIGMSSTPISDRSLAIFINRKNHHLQKLMELHKELTDKRG